MSQQESPPAKNHHFRHVLLWFSGCVRFSITEAQTSTVCHLYICSFKIIVSWWTIMLKFYYTIICQTKNVKVAFFFSKIYLVCTTFKVFIELVTSIASVFMLCFFGHEACGILAPWLGIKSTSSALEGKVLITGPPGKSPK